MTSKMSREDSIVGYNKNFTNYIMYDEDDSDYTDEEDFYDQYEPYEEEIFDDYQPFIPDDEEEKKSSSIRILKPCKLLNSPTKTNVAKSPIKSPSWWEKKIVNDSSNRIINGVLNYSALLPPSTPKSKVAVSQPKKIKNKTCGKTNPQPKKVTITGESDIQKPTRLCLSVTKKIKCFHGSKCRFAHKYSELKECNFGQNCKKVNIIKTNSDNTVELSNKNGIMCTFKHAKESQNSYLKRVPQQHTSPKK